MYLLEDDTKLGTVLMLHVSGRSYEWTQHSASLRRVLLNRKPGGPCAATSSGTLRWKYHMPECRVNSLMVQQCVVSRQPAQA